MQFQVALRNARLDAIETDVGASPVLEFRTGSAPAATTDADSGTLLASLPLPADWLAAAAGGTKAKAGTWQDTSADASGTPGHWRLKTSGGTVKAQGTAGIGSGEASFDVATSLGGVVTVTAWTFTEGNA